MRRLRVWAGGKVFEGVDDVIWYPYNIVSRDTVNRCNRENTVPAIFFTPL
jgi:hypothetical protein